LSRDSPEKEEGLKEEIDDAGFLFASTIAASAMGLCPIRYFAYDPR
jgi:hypothetical protein